MSRGSASLIVLVGSAALGGVAWIITTDINKPRISKPQKYGASTSKDNADETLRTGVIMSSLQQYTDARDGATYIEERRKEAEKLKTKWLEENKAASKLKAEATAKNDSDQ